MGGEVEGGGVVGWMDLYQTVVMSGESLTWVGRRVLEMFRFGTVRCWFSRCDCGAEGGCGTVV